MHPAMAHMSQIHQQLSDSNTIVQGWHGWPADEHSIYACCTASGIKFSSADCFSMCKFHAGVSLKVHEDSHGHIWGLVQMLYLLAKGRHSM